MAKQKRNYRNGRYFLVTNLQFFMLALVFGISKTAQWLIKIMMDVVAITLFWIVGFMLIFQRSDFIIYTDLSPDEIFFSETMFAMLGIMFIIWGFMCGINGFQHEFVTVSEIDEFNDKADNIFAGRTRLSQRLGVQPDYSNVIPPAIEYQDYDPIRLLDLEDLSQNFSGDNYTRAKR